ncbi:MAG: hypothetical protein ACE14M_13930 [Terriglobales bacterium]
MAAIAVSPLPDCSYFFRQLAQAEQGVLVLDYDSAVARFGPFRQWRFPGPTVYEVLDSILSTTRTRVVIVSKRRSGELQRVLGSVADPGNWHSGNLQLITLNGTYHKSTPQSLLANLCPLGPLAYLGTHQEPKPAPASRNDAPLEELKRELLNSLRKETPASVQPRFFLGDAQSWLGEPEDLVQFLIDWLRACGGELC